MVAIRLALFQNAADVALSLLETVELPVVAQLRGALADIHPAEAAEVIPVALRVMTHPSFHPTMLAHAQQIASQLIQQRHLDCNSLVVEVASNDGYLLQFYHSAGIPVLGVEPAENIARIAEERGIRTVSEFFDASVADEFVAGGWRADVIHANNVLAHVPDLNGVVEGFSKLLKPDGVAVIEVPYARDLIERGEFDTIYHEHLCYFWLTSLDRLFRRNGLRIYDIELLSIHGGTLRVYASRTAESSSQIQMSPAVLELLADETERLLQVVAFELGRIGDRVERLKKELLNLLRDLKSKGKRIAVYGASAKGSTLLNYFGLGSETLDFVVDRSTVKQGHFTPGSHLKICPPEKLLEENPEFCLLLTWNFADEILEQQAEYRQRGGRFIVPIPELKIL